jgi:hypothetical protein
MKLACKFAIGLLNVIRGCTATDAEYLVVVFRFDCHRIGPIGQLGPDRNSMTNQAGKSPTIFAYSEIPEIFSELQLPWALPGDLQFALHLKKSRHAARSHVSQLGVSP